MSHSHEPWTYGPTLNNGYKLFGCYDQHYLSDDLYNEADAVRIVTCINACRGIPNDALIEIVQTGLNYRERYYRDCNENIPDWVTKALEIQ